MFSTPFISSSAGTDWRAEANQTASNVFAPPPASGTFRDFIKGAWPIVEPGMAYRPAHHIDMIADHLEAVRRGQIRNLVINIPPGHAKSVVVGVLWPAWVWIDWPEWRGLFSSYDLSLVTRDAVRSRDVMESEWYQKEFGLRWKFKGDQNVKTFYKNTKQGFRFCHTVAGKGTGHRGDAIICDDPLNALNRHSVKKRLAVIDWWNRTMPTRLNDPATGVKVIIMQRLHEEDLTAEVLRQGGYEHLCMMSEFVPDRKFFTFYVVQGERKPFREDWRKERDELLFPGLFPQPILDELKNSLGEEAFEAQHQQNPTPAEGGMFKERYWRYWCYPGQKLPPVKVAMPDGTLLEIEAVELPSYFDRVVQSWDMTFKQKKTSDYVVGQVWGALMADRFLLDQYRDKSGFNETVAALRDVTDRWPHAMTKFVEDKANGSAILDHLGREIGGLVPIEPVGDKEERGWAVEPIVRSGNVYLPHPQIATFTPGFLAESKAFPNGTNDDQVDAATQALIQLATYAPPSPTSAMLDTPYAQYQPR